MKLGQNRIQTEEKARGGRGLDIERKSKEKEGDIVPATTKAAQKTAAILLDRTVSTHT